MSPHTTNGFLRDELVKITLIALTWLGFVVYMRLFVL